MVDLFSSLELAKKSLLTHQFVFHVIGHNIANVNTPEYSRQRVELGVVKPFKLGFRSVGVGVDVIKVHGIRDKYLEYQIQKEIQTKGKASYLGGAFKIIEAIFQEQTDTGISKIMENFFNSWNDLANNPTGMPERTTVLNNAKVLADKIKETYRRLREQQAVQNNDVALMVEDINQLGDEIASLNQQITEGEVGGAEMNDLRDRRNKLLQDLGEKVGINVYENEMGQVTVEVGGRPFVVGNQANHLEIQKDATNYNYYDVYINEADHLVDITYQISGGELNGLIEMRDTNIPEYIKRLDNLAYGIITNVNNLHSTGFDLNGNTGVNFFTPFTPVAPGDYTGAAAHMEVNPAIADDPEAIAASSALGEVGNNEIALSIADLERSYNTVDSDNDGTFDYGTFHDYYHQLVTLVGAEAKDAYTREAAQDEVLLSLKDRRSEVSSVSLDEESATLIQFEKAYQVMARFMGVVDKMADIMVNLGR